MLAVIFVVLLFHVAPAARDYDEDYDDALTVESEDLLAESMGEDCDDSVPYSVPNETILKIFPARDPGGEATSWQFPPGARQAFSKCTVCICGSVSGEFYTSNNPNLCTGDPTKVHNELRANTDNCIAKARIVAACDRMLGKWSAPLSKNGLANSTEIYDAMRRNPGEGQLADLAQELGVRDIKSWLMPDCIAYAIFKNRARANRAKYWPKSEFRFWETPAAVAGKPWPEWEEPRRRQMANLTVGGHTMVEPAIFQEVRALLGTPETFLQDLKFEVDKSFKSAGKGKTNFVMDDERLYLLARLPMNEYLFLVNEYVDHFLKYLRTNKDVSFLTRFLSAFIHRGEPWVVMSRWPDLPNMSRESVRQFDLKGTEQNRFSNCNQHPGAWCKDKDMTSPLYVPYYESERLLRQLSRDLEFLAGERVIDYSIMLTSDTNAFSGPLENQYAEPFATGACQLKASLLGRGQPRYYSQSVFGSHTARPDDAGTGQTHVYSLGLIDTLTFFSLKVSIHAAWQQARSDSIGDWTDYDRYPGRLLSYMSRKLTPLSLKHVTWQPLCADWAPARDLRQNIHLRLGLAQTQLPPIQQLSKASPGMPAAQSCLCAIIHADSPQKFRFEESAKCQATSDKGGRCLFVESVDHICQRKLDEYERIVREFGHGDLEKGLRATPGDDILADFLFGPEAKQKQNETENGLQVFFEDCRHYIYHSLRDGLLKSSERIVMPRIAESPVRLKHQRERLEWAQILEARASEDDVETEDLMVGSIPVKVRKEFGLLRRADGVSDNFLKGLNLLRFTAVKSAGFSKSVFIQTEDGKYLVTDLPHQEFLLLLGPRASVLGSKADPYDFLKAYAGYIESNSDSLLVRIYAAFTIEGKAYIAMRKLADPPNPASEHSRAYDLKGTEQKRLVGKVGSASEVTLKDLDFQGNKIKVWGEERTLFLTQLYKDVAFLRSQRVIDYSIYLKDQALQLNEDWPSQQGALQPYVGGTCNGERMVYAMGIIDILTLQNLHLTVHAAWQELRSDGRPDYTDAQTYSERLPEFMLQAIDEPGCEVEPIPGKEDLFTRRAATDTEEEERLIRARTFWER